MKKFILPLLVFLLCQTITAQQKVTLHNAEVIPMTFLGETQPFKDIKSGPPGERTRKEKLGYVPKGDWPLHEKVNPNALPQGMDPAWQTKYPTTNDQRVPVQSYDGLGYSFVNPADPNMDVGPNHIVQMINQASGSTVQIWDKTGTILAGPFALDQVGGNYSGLGDPIVLYDAIADRWLLSEFASSGNQFIVMISKTSDPTGSYFIYTFTAPNFPDYPKYAVWSDAYYMTSNESGPSPVYAMDRSQMLLGNPATVQRFTVPDSPTIGFQATTPVTHDTGTPPPAGAPGMIMRMADDGWGVAFDRLEMWDVNVDFVTPANSNLNGPTYLATVPFDTELCGYFAFACFGQPGGGPSLDPLREVLMNRIQYRNFGTHEALVCNHVTDVTGNDDGGIRWYELRRLGGIANPWSIYQQGTYAPDATSRWMAAIAINESGEIGLMYNVVDNTSVFPGLRYTGRCSNDPLGTMPQGETVIVNGSAANASNRYGDYNSLDTDPANGATFWGTGMYNTAAQWSTRIAAFNIDNCICLFEATCPLVTDLGDFDCTQIGNIPAPPTSEAEAEAAPYNMTIGDMPCGTIVVLSMDDIFPPDVCAMGGQTVNRTVTVFDDLNGNGTLDAGEESEDCTYTFDILEDTTPPVITCTEFAMTYSACPNGYGPNTPNGSWIVIGLDGGFTTAVGGIFTMFLDLSTCVSDNCSDLADLEVSLFDSYYENLVPGCSIDIINEFIVRDPCENTTTDVITFRGTIQFDGPAPVIVCPPNATVECGNPTDPAATGMATATSDCGSPAIAFSDSSVPGCGSTETITRTWTATDGCGTTSTCIQTITVVDTTPPDAPTPPDPVTVQCSEDVPAPVDLTAIDVCDGAITVSPTAVITPGNCANQFVMERTWTFTDACGNTSSVSQTITIFDDTAPTLSSMPGNTTVECDAIPAPPVITATDNCVSVAAVIFINEIHYDNVGGDTGEFIEVAGTAGFDLSNCQLVLYNGSNSMVYNTMDLSGVIDNELSGFGAVDFQYPPNGIQNGSPDGMALVCGGVVIEFLSYEGVITAANGPAAGMTSIDIGVAETSSTPIGESLGQTGTGCASGFTWTGPSAESPGTLNAGQIFDLSLCQTNNDVAVIFTENFVAGNCPQAGTLTRTWTATDDCGNAVSHTQTITVVDTTVPEFCNAPIDLTVDCFQDVPVAEVLGATDNCDFSGMDSRIWINEFHYDNVGTDVGEFIEVAGVAGTDLSGYSIHTYNGSNGNTYNAAMNLSGVIDNETCNRGALSFSYPSNGLQNGSPDGFALVDPSGAVVEFLSYEGTFTANNGPAMGMTSTDVGVSETSGTPVGFSLQLTGTGGGGQDFVWTAPSADSPGSLNASQVIRGNLVATLVEDNQATQCDGGKITRTWTVEDACGNAATPHVQIITVLPPPPPVITCPADQTIDCIDNFVLDPNNATATSLCGNIVAIYIKNPYLSGVPGCDGTIYTYIYVAVDDCGRSSECEQQVLIQNVPATLTVPAGGVVDCYDDIEISVDEATVNGACAAYNVYLTTPELNGAKGCPGTTYTYTYRLVDACGNIVEEDVVFTNANNAGPTITAPVDLVADCLGGVTPNPNNATVETSCGTGSTVTVTGPQVFGPIDCNGTVYRYTYTVTDDCGRTATDTQDFTVNNGPPVFESCPDDNWLVLNCEDYGGEAGTIQVIEAWIASVKASTSCGVPLTVFNNFNSNNINTCVNNGYNTVTFRATDACGRTSFCTGVYVVVDTEAPIITTPAQDHWEMCNYNTQANLTAWVQAHGDAVAYDGCSNDNISWQASPANPQINCIGAGSTTTVTVTFIVTDNCGNKTSTTATFNALSPPDFTGEDNEEQSLVPENTDQIDLFQNQPNPFKNETLIGFYLPEAMSATLVIYDISGKEIKRVSGDYAEGYNSLLINRSELNATGFLLYQLQTEKGAVTKRMILME